LFLASVEEAKCNLMGITCLSEEVVPVNEKVPRQSKAESYDEKKRTELPRAGLPQMG